MWSISIGHPCLVPQVVVYLCCSTDFILIDLVHTLTRSRINHIQLFIMAWCSRIIPAAMLYYPFVALCCVSSCHIIRFIIGLILSIFFNQSFFFVPFPIQGSSSLFMHTSNFISICSLVIIYCSRCSILGEEI
ncbi:hypothetical protein BDA99DRAFT_169200 [Phascolomyces articulosus]|uniref:Uncharacterized protein n=1 Tax=Phascolomyces articulosus TaxID=60185 RepID=A0AAD5PAT5_9FUNG|nr:hypothetical protein BDA99DRAFT_169200 [Phascolomyces articulosus]